MDANIVVDGCKTEDFQPYSYFFYGNHTNYDYYPWIRIDMNTSPDVGSGQIWNRGHDTPGCCEARLDGFEIWIGDSPTFNGLNNINCYTLVHRNHHAAQILSLPTLFLLCGLGQICFSCSS
jgi:hypothetical protein